MSPFLLYITSKLEPYIFKRSPLDLQIITLNHEILKELRCVCARKASARAGRDRYIKGPTAAGVVVLPVCCVSIVLCSQVTQDG